MRAGEWFEGCYVFVDDAARDAFETSFRETAAGSPGSQLIGSPPILIERCTVVAVAEGAAGFAASGDCFGASPACTLIGSRNAAAATKLVRTRHLI
jgi:hypothetical protein